MGFDILSASSQAPPSAVFPIGDFCIDLNSELALQKILQVFVPSTDKDSLMREVTDGQFRPEAAKAIVDDCYLGYVKIRELRAVLETLSSTDTCLDEVSPEHMTCRAIVAECLACRSQELCNLAVEYMAVSLLSLSTPYMAVQIAIDQSPSLLVLHASLGSNTDLQEVMDLHLTQQNVLTRLQDQVEGQTRQESRVFFLGVCILASTSGACLLSELGMGRLVLHI